MTAEDVMLEGHERVVLAALMRGCAPRSIDRYTER